MAGERLTSRDKRALLLWVLAGVMGALCAYKFYFRAFPEASVNFQVSREDALKRAQAFVAGMGEDLSGYQSAIIFEVNENAKTYLEREVGLQQANRLMSTQLNIWYWNVRFFKPQQEEEFLVRVSPAGQVVGYERQLEEGRPGTSLEQAAALEKAQEFAVVKLGMALQDWTLLNEEATSEQRPHRRDWSFTWEKKGFRAKDAPYRLNVVLQGDGIGEGEEYLKVPEAWNRSFAQLRAQNNFLTTVAIVPYLLVLAAALWLGIALTRRGTARWRGAILLGVVVTALLFCMQLNAWPEARMQYDTNSSYATFILKQLVGAVLFGIGSAITVTLVLPAGDALYRVTQPARLQLRKAFRLRGLRSKEFFCSSVVGLSLTAASLGFVVLFYMIGSKYGVWAPQDINYENSVSTLFPWISGVAIGLLASTNEEFTFRLFAIPFLERLTGSRWLAVILPAFFWSFLHTNYPQEPPYIRGLEVGLMGIATGLVFLRWGIVATLIWHYTFDASQVGLLLIRSHSWYFRISGVVVGLAAVAPLLFSAISYVQRGGFEAVEDLQNGAEPVPDVSLRMPGSAEAGATVARRYTAMSPAVLALLLALTVCGALAAWRLHAPAIGDYLELSVDARSAQAKADAILRARGVDPSSYRHAVVFVDNTDPQVNEFMRERVGIAKLNDIYSMQVPGALWRVRYFRDSQKEEYAVILKPDGALHSVWHILPEDAPGAELSKDAAIALGEKYLREEKHLDLQQWNLVVTESSKLPHRLDYTLEWESDAPLTVGIAAGHLDGAHARVRVLTNGDEIARYQTYIKIPDDWSRRHQSLTVPRVTFSYGVPALVFLGLGVAMLVVLLRNVRAPAAKEIPWRRLALWSAWAVLAFYVVFALGNAIPELLNKYETDQPFRLTMGASAIGIVIGGPFYFGAMLALFGGAWFFAFRAFGEERLPGWLGMPAKYYRDALYLGVGGAGGVLALRRILSAAFLHWPTVHREIPASFGDSFDAISPAAAVIGHALMRGLLYTGLVALVAAFVADCVPQKWLRAALFFGGALALVGGGWGNAADYWKQFSAELISLGMVVLGVRYVMKFNLLGCFLAVAGGSLLSGLFELLGQQDAFYQRNGYAVAAALAVLLAWPLLAWLWPRPVPRGVAC